LNLVINAEVNSAAQEVPEPASFALMFVGLGLLAAAKRR